MSLSEQSAPTSDTIAANGISNYGWTTIVLHWIGAIAILVSYLTGEAMEDRSAGAYASHVSWAAVLAIPLIVRVVWRMADGIRRTSDQAAIFHLASKIVMIGFLVTIVVSVVTGILLPWSVGNPLEVFSLSIPSPLPRMRELHEVLEETHEVAVHLFIPLVALHIAGALKHAFVDRDNVLKGIFLPVGKR